MAAIDDLRTASAVGPKVLDSTTLDSLFARAADVVALVDVSSGELLRRWYDPEHSRLHLPESPDERIINWIHPDDITEVLEAIAHTVREGGTRSLMARLHPDRQRDAGGEALMITVHDVDSVTELSVLLQAWLVDVDRAPTDDDHDPATAMSSLAAAAPVGLQVRSGNGSVSFENERFTDLAEAERGVIDRYIDVAIFGSGERFVDLEAGERHLRLRVVPTLDDAGNFVVAVASLEDVTSLRQAEEGRAAAEGLFRAVFDGSPIATAIVDLDGCFSQVNESFAVICGYSPDELVGRHFADITHPDDLAVDEELVAEVAAGTRSSYQLEKRYLHAAGHEIWVNLTVAAVRGAEGALRNFVAHVEDITDRKAAFDPSDSVDDLAHWATHDHLTGLPNRRYLDRFLGSMVGQGRRAEDRYAVLFLDLDDFKPVNDEYGHQVGDEVLRTVARRLRNACRDDVLVVRYGGDEFVVIARQPRTAHDLSVLVERIQSAVRTPIAGLEGPITVGASIGIAVSGPDDAPAAVIQRADEATYRAKSEGKGRARYSPG